jgi:G3E family GTPase
VTLTTLVSGARPAEREAAIAAVIDPGMTTALILEGLPDGTTQLDGITDLPTVHIARIAPGCLCCTGNLTMRVTLNRILRHPPARLYISLATTAHLAQIRSFLQQPPYDKLLALTKDIVL